MKIWAKVLKHHRMIQDVVQEFASARPSSVEEWHAVLTQLCEPLDLAVPVILKKHVDDWEQFQRALFKKSDFMEPVSFDVFEVEILPEQKKETRVEYIFD